MIGSFKNVVPESARPLRVCVGSAVPVSQCDERAVGGRFRTGIITLRVPCACTHELGTPNIRAALQRQRIDSGSRAAE
jgi:hypothetical protein